MTPLEERFVAEYRVSRNATQSALRAGYSGLHASRYGSRLLRNPAVIEALRAEGVEIAHGVHPPSQVRAPRASAPMTPRQLAFVAQYRLSRNAAQAAREAGYTGRDAGLVVLRKPAVLAALAQAGVVPARGVHPRDQKRKARPPYEKRGLTVLEERFAMEYLIDGNATQAAIRSGLPSRKPLSAGTKMLHRPAVAAAIAAERQRRAERVRVSADRVLGEMARIAFSDIGAIAEWDEDGVTLKPKAEIGPHDRAAIVEIRSRRGAHGADTQIRLHSKRYALEGLARHLGLYGRGAKTIAEAEPSDAKAAREELRERLMRHFREAASPPAPAEPGTE